MLKKIINYLLCRRNRECAENKSGVYNIRTLPNGDWETEVEISDGRKVNVLFHNLPQLIERYNAPFRRVE